MSRESEELVLQLGRFPGIESSPAYFSRIGDGKWQVDLRLTHEEDGTASVGLLVGFIAKSSLSQWVHVVCLETGRGPSGHAEESFRLRGKCDPIKFAGELQLWADVHLCGVEA